MAPNPLLYQLLLVALVLICLLIHVWWRDAPSASPPTTLTPDPPRRKRSTEPKPFPGFIHIPLCAACGRTSAPELRRRPNRLLKKAKNRLLTRALQKRSHVFAGTYRAATVGESGYPKASFS